MESFFPEAMDYAQPEQAHDDAAPAETPESEQNAVATILRTKRRRRTQRVCQPCRLRKVKCTYEIPCQSCVERGHAELCTYTPQPPPKRARERRASPQMQLMNTGAALWLPPKQEWDEMRDSLSTVSQLLRDLRDRASKSNTELSGQRRATSRTSPDASSTGGALDPSIVEGMSARNALTGDTVYLGGNSVPAMVVALAHDNRDEAVQDFLQKSVLPVFALDNESATYPFVDLWGLPHGSFQRIELLCKLLPSSDSVCKFSNNTGILRMSFIRVSLISCSSKAICLISSETAAPTHLLPRQVPLLVRSFSVRTCTGLASYLRRWRLDFNAPTSRGRNGR